MNESKNSPQKRQHPITFSIGRAFRNVEDLRKWIRHPQLDRTNNGFLTVQPVRYMDNSDLEDLESDYRKTPIKGDSIYGGRSQ